MGQMAQAWRWRRQPSPVSACCIGFEAVIMVNNKPVVFCGLDIKLDGVDAQINGVGKRFQRVFGPQISATTMGDV